MLQGLTKSICVNAKKGSAVDNTPAAVDWTNIAISGTRFTTQQITSISSSITVQVTASGSPLSRLYFKIDTTVPSYTTGTPTFYGFTNISAYPVNITVNNNEYLSFGMSPGGGKGNSSTVTVTNTSDSNTVLDTFLMTF